MPEGGTFCSSCGRSVAGRLTSAAPPSSATTGPLTSGPSPAFPTSHAQPPVGVWPLDASVSPGHLQERDRTGLSRVRVASVVALLSGAVTYAVAAVLNPFQVANVSSGAGGTTVHFHLGWAAGVELAVLGVLLVLELAFLRYGLRSLSEVDPRFSTPSRFSLLALIGLPLVVGAAAILLYLVSQASQCAGTGPLTGSCLPVTSLLWTAALLFVALIVGLVGYIVGILLGIWRMGTRYRNDLFKVGAILLIFPYLSFVGWILVLVGSFQVEHRPPTGPLGEFV